MSIKADFSDLHRVKLGPPMELGDPKLKLELIPATTAGVNVRSRFAAYWDDIRTAVYARANYTCEICGQYGEIVEAHEVWEWNDEDKTQTLMGFLCLCSACHDTKHLNSQTMTYEDMGNHFINVTGWTRIETWDYFRKQYRLGWDRRMKYYRVDTSLVNRLIEK
jgi:hypothetical protein